jgi:hypothetical protein
MGRARGQHVHLLAAQGGRGRPPHWTEARIAAELSAFTEGRREWPTRSEFQAAGRLGLWKAVSHHGGVGTWAQQMGLPLRSPQDRRPRTEVELVAEAQAIIRDCGRLPNAKRLRAMGHAKLASTVMKAGGAARFREAHDI